MSSRVGDFNLAAVSAGLTAFVFYTAAGVPVLIGTAARLGLDAASTSSWFFIVFFTTGVTSSVLSAIYRQPLPINWSLPGIVLLGSLAGQFTFPELVGANLLAGVLIVLVGVLGLGGRLLAWLPLPIALGMFGGSILANMRDLVAATIDDGLVAGVTVGGYLVGRWLGWRSGAPMGLAALAGAAAIVFAQRATPVAVVWTPPTLLMSGPQFSFTAFVAVSLPLMVLAVGLGNVQGLGFLKAQGYPVPANVMTLVVGLQSVVNAVFGGHQAIVGRTGVAILASPEAGPHGGRYWGVLIANGLLIPVAFAGGPIASLLPLIPSAYVVVLAGLALWPSFQDALAKATEGKLRFGASVAFVVAATPFTLIGVPSAVWALVAGLLVSVVAERDALGWPHPFEGSGAAPPKEKKILPLPWEGAGGWGNKDATPAPQGAASLLNSGVPVLDRR